MKREIEVLQCLKEKFGAEGYVRRDRRVFITVDAEKVKEAILLLKNKGYEHLSAISVTDWIKDGEFEITYHLWSYESKILVTLKTRIKRDKAIIESISDIWGGNARTHEREMHELFGVEFLGNDDLVPLFLEDWDGPPPFRKDFDWRAYVREKFYSMDNERERSYYD
ncbi:MAG: NADH-quinone oxidoreductase subunit C [Thermoplasmata archaeon]|nr:MAG: NADH-quinone oxidoreductase subunit C [Thermoplasmata archaeon]